MERTDPAKERWGRPEAHTGNSEFPEGHTVGFRVGLENDLKP